MSRTTRAGTLQKLQSANDENNRLKKENAAIIKKLKEQQHDAKLERLKQQQHEEKLERLKQQLEMAKKSSKNSSNRKRKRDKTFLSNNNIHSMMSRALKSSRTSTRRSVSASQIRGKKSRYWIANEINDFMYWLNMPNMGSCRFVRSCRNVKCGDICKFKHYHGYRISEEARILALRKSGKAPKNAGTVMCNLGNQCRMGLKCTFRH